MRIVHTLARMVLAAAAAVVGLSGSGTLAPQSPADLVSQAHAVIGRPLTPISYAGVARRTTVRAAAYAAPAPATAVVAAPAAAPAAYGPVVYTYHPGCVQVVGPNGGVAYRCP